MEKVDIFDQEIGRAAIECNGNLVVVFNGKKAFWFKEQIESFVKEHPEAPLPLSVFCVTVSKVGEPCKYKSTGNSFSFVARRELAILALYPDESLTSWNKNKGIYPYNWIVARYARDIDRERYNIPAIPSTYLLDKNKKVIYKDAIIEAVESYLRHKYKL